MLGHRRLGDPELLLDRGPDGAGALLAVGQQLEDPASDRIAEDVEGVHRPDNLSGETYISATD